MNIESTYLEYFDLLKSPRTRGNYIRILRLLSEAIGKAPIEATKGDLNGYIIKLKQKGSKDSTISTYMAAIRSFFKWHMDNDKIKVDPSGVFSSIKVKPSQPNPKPLNEEDRITLINNLRWETLRDWQMSLTTMFGMVDGLRRFEVCKIEWDDIDLEGSRIKGSGKGDRPFDLNIPPVLLDKIKEYRGILAKQGFLGRFVFFMHDDPSKELPYGRLWDWPQELHKRCGFPKETRLTFHCLRHTFVSHIVASGKATPEEGMEMSRHSDYSTYKRYMKIREEKLKKISNDIFQ